MFTDEWKLWIDLSAGDPNVEKFVSQLEEFCGDRKHWIAPSPELSQCTVFFGDPTEDQLKKIESCRQKNQCIAWLVTSHRSDSLERIAEWVSDEVVDELFVLPISRTELVLKLRHLQRLSLLDEYQQFNQGLSQIVEQAKSSLELSERIYHPRMPSRMPELKGFKANSQYIAGLKPGGDYFDVLQSENRKTISLLLSDSSSYGLSTSVLTSLLSLSMRLAKQTDAQALPFAKAIIEEVRLTLSKDEKLGLFFGNLSRADLVLRYVNFGNSHLFVRRGDEAYQVYAPESPSIEHDTQLSLTQESEIPLSARDRLVLVSDGFLELSNGVDGICDLLNKDPQAEPEQVLTEFTYQVKSSLDPEESHPNQDCTVIVLDVDQRLKEVS